MHGQDFGGLRSSSLELVKIYHFSLTLGPSRGNSGLESAFSVWRSLEPASLTSFQAISPWKLYQEHPFKSFRVFGFVALPGVGVSLSSHRGPLWHPRPIASYCAVSIWVHCPGIFFQGFEWSTLIFYNTLWPIIVSWAWPAISNPISSRSSCYYIHPAVCW